MAVYLSYQAEHLYTIAKMATPATRNTMALTLTRPVSPWQRRCLLRYTGLPRVARARIRISAADRRTFIAPVDIGEPQNRPMLALRVIGARESTSVVLWPPYIFALWFLSSFFLFSSPKLSGRRLDVYHTSTHGVALARI